MYDIPELRSAFDAFWAAVVDHVQQEDASVLQHELPRRPHWDTPFDQCYTSGFLFSQTCGLPLTQGSGRHMQVLGTPVSTAVPAHWSPGTYCSAVVVPKDSAYHGPEDLWRGAQPGVCIAVNSYESLSGCVALRAFLAALHPSEPAARARSGFWGTSLVLTGSHAASLDAVRARRAHVAAIDAVSLQLMQRRNASALADLRILALTEPMPGLPFVTCSSTPVALAHALRRALRAVPKQPHMASVCNQLGFRDVVWLPREHYVGRVSSLVAKASLVALGSGPQHHVSPGLWPGLDSAFLDNVLERVRLCLTRAWGDTELGAWEGSEEWCCIRGRTGEGCDSRVVLNRDRAWLCERMLGGQRAWGFSAFLAKLRPDLPVKLGTELDALDEHLLRSVRGNPNILLYATAERWPGGPWANLVVLEAEQAGEAPRAAQSWARGAAHMVAIRTAPRVYSSIRLHRGMYLPWAKQQPWCLERSLFHDFSVHAEPNQPCQRPITHVVSWASVQPQAHMLQGSTFCAQELHSDPVGPGEHDGGSSNGVGVVVATSKL